jgi:hypothetical protein
LDPDYTFDPDQDNDEQSAFGFNDPTHTDTEDESDRP